MIFRNFSAESSILNECPGVLRGCWDASKRNEIVKTETAGMHTMVKASQTKQSGFVLRALPEMPQSLETAPTGTYSLPSIQTWTAWPEDMAEQTSRSTAANAALEAKGCFDGSGGTAVCDQSRHDGNRLGVCVGVVEDGTLARGDGLAALTAAVARLTVIFLLMLFLTPHAYGQGSAGISGVVTDKATGETLPGASVFIEGTSIGTATNEEGEYKIPRVPAGSYVLVVTYIGYQEVKTDITVAGEDVVLNIEIEFAVVEGEEVVVTAQAEGQMAAINQQISAVTIKNVVSADKIQDIPDVNAAESVARLPGISLVRSGGEGQIGRASCRERV